MSVKKQLLTTNRKALTINLDGTHYGTIAEIGAGQEVARIFFQAGSASGSIAKTMSAYDMVFSDSIYGKAPRYVSRERLETMLHHEYSLLKQRLHTQRGATKRFFVFADTVVSRSAKGANDGHGWLGVRFQNNPLEEPNDIVIHVRLWDKKNVQQQEALGIVGVNLIYGAFHYQSDPEKFIRSLVDNVGADRIEVDMCKFTGPTFKEVDNRLLSLQLVRHGLTNAVMLAPDGEVLQPSAAIFDRPVLVERGSFRPVTFANIDMLTSATAQFRLEPSVKGKEVVVLMEMTLADLLADGALDSADFLARIDMLGQIGYTVLISNYTEFFRLVAYFRRYTKAMIGVALWIDTMHEIFNEKYYDNLEGGILESMGRMFRHGVRLYCYPLPHDNPAGADQAQQLVTAENMKVAEHLDHLYAHLLKNKNIVSITGYDEKLLHISARDVAKRIKAGDSSWVAMVPPKIADTIKKRHLLGYLGKAKPRA